MLVYKEATAIIPINHYPISSTCQKSLISRYFAPCLFVACLLYCLNLLFVCLFGAFCLLVRLLYNLCTSPPLFVFPYLFLLYCSLVVYRVFFSGSNVYAQTPKHFI